MMAVVGIVSVSATVLCIVTVSVMVVVGIVTVSVMVVVGIVSVSATVLCIVTMSVMVVIGIVTVSAMVVVGIVTVSAIVVVGIVTVSAMVVVGIVSVSATVLCIVTVSVMVVVGIVTVSATANEADRTVAHLSRFNELADELHFEQTAIMTQVISRPIDMSSHVQQSAAAAAAAAASHSTPSPAVVTCMSPTHVPADISLLLFDDQLSPQLPPPLIPVPDRYQPLVDIDASEPAVPSDQRQDKTHHRHAVPHPGSPKTGECSVCMEHEPNAALYPCGHMSMCYECAISVQKLRGALCPICRQPIIDILRIYRS